MLPLLFSTGMPDFAQVYSFIGSVFDPNTSGHLEKLKEMDPINVETVRLLLNLNHFHSVRVFSDSFFPYLNHAFCWIFVYLMGGSTILSKASTQYNQVFFSLEHFFIARKQFMIPVPYRAPNVMVFFFFQQFFSALLLLHLYSSFKPKSSACHITTLFTEMHFSLFSATSSWQKDILKHIQQLCFSYLFCYQINIF